jgi:hypothetical protein
MQEIPKIRATTYKHPRWKNVVKVGDLFKINHTRVNHVVIITDIYKPSYYGNGKGGRWMISVHFINSYRGSSHYPAANFATRWNKVSE